MNQALSLAGYGAPLVSSANASQNAQQQLANQSQAGWLGLAGTAAGGLLQNPGVVSSAYDWLGDTGSSILDYLGGGANAI
jgi:hypothetical protein